MCAERRRLIVAGPRWFTPLAGRTPATRKVDRRHLRPSIPEVEAASASLGLGIVRQEGRVADDVEPALDAAASGRKGALLPLSTPILSAEKQRIDAFSARVEADERDTTTPAAMAGLLTLLLGGSLLSADSLALLEAMMLRCQSRQRLEPQRLKARLPAGTLVARKGGTLCGVINDVGWVTLPDGRRFVAAVYTRHGVTPRVQLERVVEEIGRLLYSAFLEPDSTWTM